MENFKQPHLNISRRSFLYGGAAAIVAGGLGLSGCSAGGLNTDPVDAKIRAAVSYSSSQTEVVGQTEALTIAAHWHVFEGLYEFDYHSGWPYPALAKQLPDKIDDKTYRITLRDNAKFSNGTFVTPTDVVSSIGAFKANNTYAPFLDFLRSTEADGDNSIILHLKYPFEDLLAKRLSLAKIYNASSDRSITGSKKIGTGPWVLDEFKGEDGGHVSFSPNPYYNGIKGKAKDKMYWNVKLNPDDRTSLLCNRTVKCIENAPSDDIDNIDNVGANVVHKYGLGMCFLIFNTMKEPFNDKRVRQAIMYAIDTDTLIKDKMYGEGKASTCILPTKHENYHRASTVYDFNAKKAEELLKDAGQEEFDMELWVAPNWVKDLGPLVRDNLEEIGINCKLKTQTVAWDSISKTDEVPPFDVLLTPADPSVFGIDPDLIMNVWWGDNVFTNARSCWAKCKDSRFSELQELLNEARMETGSKQQEIWNQCFDLIADECPIYPLFHRPVPTGFYQELLNSYRPVATTGLYFIDVSAA